LTSPAAASLASPRLGDDLVERSRLARREELVEALAGIEHERDAEQPVERDLAGALEPLEASEADAGALREPLLAEVRLQPAGAGALGQGEGSLAWGAYSG
jgi:hypothetical protein